MTSAREVIRKSVPLPLTWAAITVAAGILAVGTFQPRLCSETVACGEVHKPAHNAVSRYAICMLATCLIMELASLYLTWKRAQSVVDIVVGVEFTFIPPMLLATAFFVLIIENIAVCNLWLIHAAAPGVGDMPARPVFSSIILEWLVNVPILIALAGASALGRPLREVARPLVVTNLYIILSWSAYFIGDGKMRWLAIGVSFGMYLWASVDMALWVYRFRKATTQDLPARNLRCALNVGLILAFFVYGLVYLAAMAGLLSSEGEMLAYVVMNVSVKLGFLLAFVGIRSSQFFDLIVGLLANSHLPHDGQVSLGDEFGYVEGASTVPLLY
mmetsp:Transcript_47402/g.138231  ORF Transcript_47402/g.138231 Transcript_47402/m.138231 type:complete len:329 (-) Transcript_47402:73-1059(-)